jgi:1-aminocyclopropane-1-carboxylate deaminase/D-cysteine desulfhydrase-like pyridoxal-dependent ACC family enzyme
MVETLTSLKSTDAPVPIAEIRRRVATIPRVSLALTPTPLHEAPRLAEAIGVGRLFIKRDDLTGLAMGGNKTRNLEFRMADAVAKGADVFIAGLEAQSNSARQTTAAANLLGMKPVLVLRNDRDWNWQGNLLVDRILGADIRFVETKERATVDQAMDQALHEVAAEQRALGRNPYVMNHNPAFALGSAFAYLLCTLEIVEQMATLNAEPTHLYMASGNKGHAGLVLAQKLLDASFRSVAISQHYGDDRVSGALEGARGVARALGFAVQLAESDVESYDDYVETDYGLPSPSGMAALVLAARTEGLLLDPIYTAKAMAGLIDHARQGKVGKESTVVFIHTGGLPVLFAFKDEILAATAKG